MKQRRILMGMPVMVEVTDPRVTSADIDTVFKYFEWVDGTFSTYKSDSEIRRLGDGRLDISMVSPEVREILRLSEETKRDTGGYFDIYRNGHIDPSGIVKGWAIRNAAGMLSAWGFTDYYVDAGGDIQLSGVNASGNPWTVGIRDPFTSSRIVKTIRMENGGSGGIATSGTYIRGHHIWDPTGRNDPSVSGIVSLTVIGPDILEADRYATAAFAMGARGIEFIGSVRDLEGYMIYTDGHAAYTEGFVRYVVPTA